MYVQESERQREHLAATLTALKKESEELTKVNKQANLKLIHVRMLALLLVSDARARVCMHARLQP